MNPHSATIQETETAMNNALAAFFVYRKTSPEQRAQFLEAIAKEIDALGDQLILKASEETHLPAGRLLGERARTTMQLRAFAAMLREGSWARVSIDTAVPDRAPLPKPDLRKMLTPLGPIVVFGASNFPFAYSTAGGDTASALAAGCPVVVKAHPAHAETSDMVYGAIKKAIQAASVPEGVFQHLYGGNDIGKALVQHPATAGVGFTGSFTGGNALLKYAQERKNPIPVFCEMGSVNPVVILPQTLQENGAQLVKMYADSITQSMGQFCTNPGIILAQQGAELDQFIQALAEEVEKVQPAPMLHEGIQRSYVERMHAALSQTGVETAGEQEETGSEEAVPRIATVEGRSFLANHLLQEEVFGPYSLVVRCKDGAELKEAWKALQGQLTTSLMGTEKDFQDNRDLVEEATLIAGRIIFNGVPTGVEVCPSMVHGGPYPATTDSRFTAVGIESVNRWVRPVCYQNCPEELLPDELKNSNPLHLLRFVNSTWTREAVQ
ncbi:MAG: aldehyde dehydrogenase (NADP(+)) [Williamsia sp.]|nr:aldehyde dehydrogenase (NADP(+)) [Williamsia sp.]